VKAVVISQNTDRVQGSMSAMGDGQGGQMSGCGVGDAVVWSRCFPAARDGKVKLPYRRRRLCYATRTA